jgi:hypothetical protein
MMISTTTTITVTTTLMIPLLPPTLSPPSHIALLCCHFTELVGPAPDPYGIGLYPLKYRSRWARVSVALDLFGPLWTSLESSFHVKLALNPRSAGPPSLSMPQPPWFPGIAALGFSVNRGNLPLPTTYAAKKGGEVEETE